MKDQFAALLEKEMDRKEFMRFIGVGAMLLLGGGVIMNTLGNLNLGSGVTGKKSKSAGTGYGYGSSAYGGTRR